MPVTYTITRRDQRSLTATGGSVTFTVSVGPRGPNLISDATALGTLTDVNTPAFLLVGNAAGTFARKLTHPSPSPAGTFNLASLTIDAFGRVTAASNGTVSAATISDSTATGRAVLTAASAAAARSAIGAGVGDALTSGTLGQFAATTSAQLAGVLTDETGSGGGFVRATGPTLTSPTLITPVLSGATAGRVTFADAGGVVTSDAGLTYDAATDTLTVGVAGASGLVFARGLLTNTDNVGGVRLTSSEVSLFPATRIAWYATAGFNTADLTFSRNAAGVGQIGTTAANALGSLLLTNLTASGLIGLGTYTVATLPSASANVGRIAQATDSNSTTRGATPAGGGSNRVIVFALSTGWVIV